MVAKYDLGEGFQFPAICVETAELQYSSHRDFFSTMNVLGGSRDVTAARESQGMQFRRKTASFHFRWASLMLGLGTRCLSWCRFERKVYQCSRLSAVVEGVDEVSSGEVTFRVT